MASSRELQRRADQARERLSDRLTELGDQLSPSAVIGDLLTIDYDKARQDVTQFLSKQVRGNPLAFALIAAGIGWLMISEVGGPSSRPHSGRGSRPGRARRTAKVRRRHGRIQVRLSLRTREDRKGAPGNRGSFCSAPPAQTLPFVLVALAEARELAYEIVETAAGGGKRAQREPGETARRRRP